MIELRALGTLELRFEDSAAVDAVLSQPKRAAILVYLAAAGRGGYLRRDPLLALFWPEQDETKARGSLRQALYALKQDLGGGLIVTRGDDEVGLSPDVLWCDVRAFDDAIASEELERAAELYRGPFLSGFFLKGNAEFDQWVEGERDRLTRKCGQALETLAERAVERDDIPQAVEWLRRLAAHNPYSTRVALKYMEALAASGDRAGALKYAERLSERVEEDLGAAPSPDVTSYAEQLKREPVARHETRFIRVKDRTPAGGMDAVRAALADRYTVDRELGSGGMATVYLAEDSKHHRKVAIKVLKPELAAAIGSERFLREIEIVAQLHHPHILPVHDSGEAGQFLYYVMPFVEGESVRDRLGRETQLPIDDAVAIASQVAGALDYAHRKQIVHRDIKPENILLQDGQALVADFGIALAVQAVGDTRLTETGLSIGTPQYMSPEQAAGDRQLDGRSDIYSLGCVLYEMLAGEPPHTGPTTQAVLAKIATDEPRDIVELRQTVPEHVARAARTALAKLPADRFERGLELAEAVQSPAFGPAKVAAREARHVGTVRLRRAVVGLAVMVATMTVVALLGWLRSPTAPQGPLIWVNLDLDQDLVVWDVARDGSALVYRSPAGTFVRELGLPEPSKLASIGPTPFFSPDGRFVGGIGNSHIAKAARDGGPATEVVELPGGNSWLYGATWGSDDHIYFTNGHANGLSRVSSSGGDIEVVSVIDSAAGELSHRFAEVVDGGVLFTSWWADSSRIMGYHFDSGALTRVAAGSTPRYMSDGYLMFGTLDGALQTIQFDAKRMIPVGSPIGMVDGVEVDQYGHVRFAVAENGTLVYQPVWEAQFSLMAVDPTGGERAFLTEPGPIGNGYEISPDGTRVSYTRSIPGATEVWVHTSSASKSRVTSSGRNFFPIWSPDGEYLAFSSDRGSRGFALYKKRADGSGEAELLLDRPAGAYPVSWSPAGFILFWDNEGGMGMVADNGSAEEWAPVPDCAKGCGGYSRLSPDGRYIAHLKDGALYVSDLANPLATRQQVSVDRGGNPRWSPDGRKIYYYTRQELWAASLDVNDRVRVVERRKLLDLNDRGFELSGGLGLAVDPVSGDLVFRRDHGPPRPNLVAVLNFGDELRARVGSR